MHRVHFDSDGDHFTIENVQDVEPILDHNKELRGQAQRNDWGRHIASIPNVLIVKWMNEEWARGNQVMPFSKPFDEVIARKLRDPEYAYLRTDCQASQFRMGYGK